jgi:hypothetical protein
MFAARLVVAFGETCLRPEYTPASGGYQIRVVTKA